jgi:hypothetical protein
MQLSELHLTKQQSTTNMATRSRIGIELKNGSVLSVYCHWDGYPEHNGKKLKEHFNTRAKVAELIDGGDISALWTNVDWDNETLPTTGPLYYSSRGDNCPPRLDADLAEYLLPENSEEFAYVFRNGEWVCYNMHQYDNSKLPEVVTVGEVSTIC